MRCPVCRHPLAVRTHETREYRDAEGRVYRRIRWPKYHPCPRKADPEFHPAAKAEGSNQ